MLGIKVLIPQIAQILQMEIQVLIRQTAQILQMEPTRTEQILQMTQVLLMEQVGTLQTLLRDPQVIQPIAQVQPIRLIQLAI